MTQNDAVIAYLKYHGSMTDHDAEPLGIKRLGARIWELRRQGYAIHAETIDVPSRWGGGWAHVARYSFRRCTVCDRPLDLPGGENVTGLCPACLLEDAATVGGLWLPTHTVGCHGDH